MTNPSPPVHEAPLGNPSETVTSSHFKLSKLFLQLLDINKIRSSFSSFSKLPKLNNTDIMFIGSAFQKLHIQKDSRCVSGRGPCSVSLN